jgi:hypothetical protein
MRIAGSKTPRAADLFQTTDLRSSTEKFLILDMIRFLE